MGKFVISGILAVASTYGLARYTYGLFLPHIQEDLGLTLEVMGFIAGGSYLGYVLATWIGMSVSAIYGPRRPVIIGCAAAALGMICIATATNPWHLAFGVFLAGTSPGFAYPPVSDAVMKAVTEPRRERAYAWINSGTGFGVIASGPIALWAGADWRTAWLIFSGVAMAAALLAYWHMPHGRYGGHGSQLPKMDLRFFSRQSARPLFSAALIMGVITSVYWTFAVDLLISHGTWPSERSILFWVLIGASGIFGALAGDLVHRFGLRAAFRALTLIVGVSILLLPLGSSSLILSLASGILFGSSFIAVTAVLGIWSIAIYNDRPSSGFGMTFLLVSLGQILGPIVTGLTASYIGLDGAFLGAAFLCLSITVLTWGSNVTSMTKKSAL